MLFNEFISQLKKIDSVELPSSSSHNKMAPTNRDELLKKSNLENKVPREAAVMMLFYPVKNQTNLVFAAFFIYSNRRNIEHGCQRSAALGLQ